MTDIHDIYTRHADDIYRFALYLCGDAEDAEDITAETFTRVLTGTTPLIQASVKGYLLTIARNLYYESLRRRKRMTDLPPDLVDTSPDPVRALGERTDLEAVLARLQEFPEIDRAALLLRSDGLAYAEIAKVLGISLAAAKVKVHRLRLKLAEWRAERDRLPY